MSFQNFSQKKLGIFEDPSPEGFREFGFPVDFTFLVFEKRIDDTDAPFQDGIQDPRLKFHHNFEWMGGSHDHPVCVYALAVEAELLDGKRLLASNMECVGGAWWVWEYARCVIVLSLVGYRFHNVILHGLSH